MTQLGNSDWKEKAEEFLRSYLNDDNSSANEAAIYFLSRGEKNDLVEIAIDNAIKRWKESEVSWGHWTLSGFGYAAQVLRLIKWAEIGSLKEDWSRIYDDLVLPTNLDFHRGLLSTTYVLYNNILPLLRSDLAIQNMRPKLSSMIFQWQDCLGSFFKRKRRCDSLVNNTSFEQKHAMLVSAFIFGVNRLQTNDVSETILSKSIQYLLDNQSDSGLWGGDESMSSTNVMLASMGIHALYPTQKSGSKRCIDKAVKWLLEHQQSGGGWYHLGKGTHHHNVYAIVLALDALELANGGTQVTFDMTTIEEEASEITETKSSVNIDTVNISLNAEKSSKSKKKANAVSRRLKSGNAKDFKFKPWQGISSTRLILDGNRIKFKYNDDKPIDLKIKSESRVFNLLIFLASANIPSKEIKDNKSICKTPKTKPSEVVRAAHEKINKEIQTAGSYQLPNNIRFIQKDELYNTYELLVKFETPDGEEIS